MRKWALVTCRACGRQVHGSKLSATVRGEPTHDKFFPARHLDLGRPPRPCAGYLESAEPVDVGVQPSSLQTCATCRFSFGVDRECSQPDLVACNPRGINLPEGFGCILYKVRERT